MPGQDQIIGGMSSTGFPHNVIRGAQQSIEMNHGLQMDPNGGNPEDDDEDVGAPVQGMRDQQWAEELRRADERGNEVRLRCDDLKKANQDLEGRVKMLEEGIEKRDIEILRLGELYQGGQNNDKLAAQFNQDQNQKIVGKLNNQIDFLNKENHRLQTELDLFSSDKTLVQHIDKYKQELDDLSFENSTLRKDLRELTKTLKDYQEQDFQRQRQEREMIAERENTEHQFGSLRSQVQQARDETEAQKKKFDDLKSAFNSDKQALQDKIEHLE